MESVFYLNTGDVAPAYESQVVDAYGIAVNLTGASVIFKLREAKQDTVVVSASAVVTSASTGMIKYSWSSLDTRTPGYYKARFEVWSLSGGLFTVPRLPDEDAFVVIRK